MFFNDRSLGMEDIFTPHFVLNYPLCRAGIFLGTGAGGFVILSMHYISSATSAPYHAIYQASFCKVMKRHCHFGHLPPAKRTRALLLADNDSPHCISGDITS
jgi:hypothetical protein